MQHKKQIQDFIGDKSFVNYVLQHNEADIQKWTEWLKENSDYQILVEEAREMVFGIPFQKQTISSRSIDQGLDRLMMTLEKPKPSITNTRFLKLNWLKAVAALFIGILGVWGFYQFSNQAELIVHNTFDGQTKQITLPDESSVHLNANSKLSFYSNFADSKRKVVSLEGEAFFEIKKMEKGTSMQINTNDLFIQVIGTKFNVNNRRSHTVVSLKEGLVQLKTSRNKEVNLKAGKVAWFDEKTEQFIINNDTTQLWGAWRHKQWLFEKDAPFMELLTRIEETYGLKANVLDPLILKKQISGGLAIESKEVLFQTIETLYDIHILEKEEGHIILQPRMVE